MDWNLLTIKPDGGFIDFENDKSKKIVLDFLNVLEEKMGYNYWAVVTALANTIGYEEIRKNPEQAMEFLDELASMHEYGVRDHANFIYDSNLSDFYYDNEDNILYDVIGDPTMFNEIASEKNDDGEYLYDYIKVPIILAEQAIHTITSAILETNVSELGLEFEEKSPLEAEIKDKNESLKVKGLKE